MKGKFIIVLLTATLTVTATSLNFSLSEKRVESATVLFHSSSMEDVTPSAFYIDGFYPNPFNNSVVARLNLPSAVDVSMDVRDITGRLVHRDDFGTLSAGAHSLRWDGSGGAPTGLYTITVTAGDRTTKRRVLLIR